MNEKKKDAIRMARIKLEMMDYSPSIKNLHLAVLDLRVMADSLARTIQKEFPEEESWEELLKSFDKTIADCMAVASDLFPKAILELCSEGTGEEEGKLYSTIDNMLYRED